MWRRVLLVYLLAISLIGSAIAVSCASVGTSDFPSHPDNFSGITSFGIAVAVDPTASRLGLEAKPLTLRVNDLLRNGGVTLTESEHHSPAGKAIIFVTVRSHADDSGLVMASVTCRLMRPLKTYEGKWAFGSVYFDQQIIVAIPETFQRKVTLIAMLQAQKVAREVANRQGGRSV